MGLDGVELVMRVEDHFGIRLTQTEAAGVRTVGDLVELCRQRIMKAFSGRCFTLPCFLSLRREVRSVTGEPLLRIRPHEPIASRLRPGQCRELWRRLADAWPEGLQRPRRVQRVLRVLWWSATIAYFVGLAPPLWQAGLWGYAVVAPLFASLFTALLSDWLTEGFCTEPPPKLATFGALARWLAGVEAATKSQPSADPEAVLEQLRPVIVEQLGVRPEDVVPQARFVEDLGVD